MFPGFAPWTPPPLGSSDDVCGISDDHLHAEVEISGPVPRWRAWQSYEWDLCVHREPSLPQGSTSFKETVLCFQQPSPTLPPSL